MFLYNELAKSLILVPMFAVLSMGAAPLVDVPGDSTATAQYLAVLQSNAGRKEKADACRELARVATPDAIAILADLLPNEELSHMARYALEPIPDPAVDDVLMGALARTQGRLLVGVIGSLGKRGNPKAVGSLREFLADADPDVVQAAARALGSIGGSVVADALLQALPRSRPVNQVAVCEGLLRCAEKLNGKSAQTVYDTLRALPFAPHQVRTAALRGAILSRGREGSEILVDGLESADLGLFSAALRTSSEMADPGVTKILCAQLDRLAADRQIMVLQTLGVRGDVRAVQPVLVAAKSCEKPVRLAAFRALSQLEDSSIAENLIDLMADPDPELASAAQETLAGLPGKSADDVIISMLASGVPKAQLVGLDLAARRRLTSALPLLFRMARGVEAAVRSAALIKIGDLGGVSDIPAVEQLLLSPKATAGDIEGAEQALSALCAKSGNKDQCASLVADKMKDADVAQKSALIRVLGSVGGGTALTLVRTAVDDSNSQIHSVAVRTLSAWGTPDAAPHLLELAKNAKDPAEKMICVRGYLGFAGHTDVAVADRLTMCREAAGLVDNEQSKKLLLGALGSIKSPDALGLITPYFEEEATREEAATATVNVAEKLLQDKAFAARQPLIEPLEKAAKATTNADLAKRANTLLEKAKEN
jgi:HEAT repeat protein